MPVLAPLHLVIQTCVGLCNDYIRCPKRKTDCGVAILCVIEDGFADFFLAMTFAPVGVLQQPVAALRQAQGPVLETQQPLFELVEAHQPLTKQIGRSFVYPALKRIYFLSKQKDLPCDF